MTSEKEKRRIRKFLRERQLLTAFNRDQKIMKRRNLKLEIDGTPQDIIVFKKKNKTIIANSYTLKTLATTKRFNTRNVERGLRERIVTVNNQERRVIKDIKLKDVNAIVLTNQVQVEKSRPLKNKVGRVFMSVTWYSELNFKGQSVTTEGGSQKQRLLTIPEERNKAEQEAFKGATRSEKLTFSPKSWRINWIHFSYFLNTNRANRARSIASL